MKTQVQVAGAKARSAQAGFTLVEIMVVIIILGLLATIVGSNVLGESDKARESTAKIEVGQIHSVVVRYMVSNPGRIPQWEDLITPDDRGHKWIEVEEEKQDPWGNVYMITSDPDYEHKPMVISFGPDGQEGTEDDIDNKSITRQKKR